MPNRYHAGIDLGTSRSSISTSSGKRLSILTCVGYCKDLIAKKRLGTDYLCGKQALEHRLSLDIVWPLADGVIREDERSLQATRLFLEHLITQTLPRKSADNELLCTVQIN